MLMGGEVTSGASAERPRPVNVFYVRDGGSNTAQWLSADVELSPWQRHFFDAGAVRRAIPEWYGEESLRYWTAAAPDVGTPVRVMKSPRMVISDEPVRIVNTSFDGDVHVIVTDPGPSPITEQPVGTVRLPDTR